mmetsp:Transcript_5693/g.12281  ORF Transcript_5693/g.12281 Transcript_5693/m.12281 type:complete len:119 (-) Transcript_5693:159-515(-)
MASIPQGCQILTMSKFCKDSALLLQRCIKENGAEGCAAEKHRFECCAEQAMPSVVQNLIDIASEQCQPQVIEFQRCVREKGGGKSAEEKCEHLDMVALDCAAAWVARDWNARVQQARG